MKKKYLEIIEILKEYGENQTPEICLEAVRENGENIQFVKIFKGVLNGKL